MFNESQSIECVIFTLRKENILLPNALVAEITSVKDIEECDNTPDWFLGNMSWRGVIVPLLSLEAAGDMEAKKVNLNTQAVILHAVGNDETQNSHPYLALVMTGVPHVSRFSRDQFNIDDEAVNDNPMVAYKVRINGASVSVLDVDAMVTMIADLADDLSLNEKQVEM